jgi:hypothetical protein
MTACLSGHSKSSLQLQLLLIRNHRAYNARCMSHLRIVLNFACQLARSMQNNFGRCNCATCDS